MRLFFLIFVILFFICIKNNTIWSIGARIRNIKNTHVKGTFLEIFKNLLGPIFRRFSRKSKSRGNSVPRGSCFSMKTIVERTWRRNVIPIVINFFSFLKITSFELKISFNNKIGVRRVEFSCKNAARRSRNHRLIYQEIRSKASV